MPLRAELATVLPSVASVEGNIMGCAYSTLVYVSGVASQVSTSRILRL
jgi:hypothetical protein